MEILHVNSEPLFDTLFDYGNGKKFKTYRVPQRVGKQLRKSEIT